MRTTKCTLLWVGLTLSAVAQAAVPRSGQVGPNATLSFEIDRVSLSRDTKSRLDTLIEDANEQGGANEVRIAAWSDNPTPLAGEALSNADHDLANSRAAAIGNYLRARCKVSIRSYNMADRPNRNVGKSEEEYQILKGNGERSQAVALVIWKRSLP